MTTEKLVMTEAGGAEGGASPAALGWEWERLLREREAARAQARTLAETTRRMDEFLGTATHELKTPVASSSLAVALAAQRLDTLQARLAAEDVALAGQAAPIQDLLRRAEESLERITRLVVDLLDVSRIGVGRLELRLARCNLAAVVAEAVEEQRQLVPTRTIRLQVPDRPLAPVLADADRIRQVATNYLTNALRYSPEDRPVDTYVQQRGNWVHVGGRDAGPGG